MGLEFVREDAGGAGAPPAARRPAPFRQHLAHCRTADGVRIAHAVAGHGPALVKASNGLSHLELDAASAIWGHAIAELSSDHMLVRHDRRGCGLSAWDVTAPTLADWVTDLEAVVEAHGLERFAMLGISDGAAVALAFAARHPQRVSRLVLHGAWVRPGVRSPRMAEADGLADLREAATSAPMAERMRKIEDAVDLTPLLDRVRCPTLLLHAAGDPEVPLTEAEWLVSRLFDARLVPLGSSHHLPQASEAAWPQWLREVRGFLPQEPDASSPLATLTERETAVVDLLTQGRDNTAIAQALGLGMKTVRNHVSNIYRKLGTGNRERTALLAYDAGLGRTFRPGSSG